MVDDDKILLGTFEKSFDITVAIYSVALTYMHLGNSRRALQYVEIISRDSKSFEHPKMPRSIILCGSVESKMTLSCSQKEQGKAQDSSYSTISLIVAQSFDGECSLRFTLPELPKLTSPKSYLRMLPLARIVRIARTANVISYELTS